MNLKRFQKKKENFSCDKCGYKVIGNGHTNHCPQCLLSKHVDIYPGDRLSLCHGLMPAVSVIKKRNDYILTHQCIKCGHEKRNKISPSDDFEKIVKILEEK